MEQRGKDRKLRVGIPEKVGLVKKERTGGSIETDRQADMQRQYGNKEKKRENGTNYEKKTQRQT